MVRGCRPTRRAGFTLIEMLIVLSIVVLLAGLLLPVLGSVRDRSRLASCASNLHQIHLALAQYSNDNSGLLPPYPSLVTAAGTRRPASSTCIEQSRELVSSLFPYARSTALWRCPSDSRPAAPRTSTCGDETSLVAGNATSYNYQGWEWSEDELGISPVRLDYSRGDASHRPLAEDDASCSSGSGTQFGLYNHGGRWNRVFFDGHVKTFSWNCSSPGRPVEK